MIDIKYCLGEDAAGIPDKNGNIFEPIRRKYNHSAYGDEKTRAFSKCMREKGYRYDHYYKKE
ncbi:hypothetical protein C7N83_10395 [Neisseria iguanae]|uniref:Uncharacterized protein n=2 Tax=Neisseria iguanae TaxID=90242 RepID=A0A2P7TYG4_9NEIS|nr:hypothetical protein C7N83_10395 [Neisseria iguanae]